MCADKQTREKVGPKGTYGEKCENIEKDELIDVFIDLSELFALPDKCEIINLILNNYLTHL